MYTLYIDTDFSIYKKNLWIPLQMVAQGSFIDVKYLTNVFAMQMNRISLL